jgi:hypothetical protein
VWLYDLASWRDPLSQLGAAHDALRGAIADEIRRLKDEDTVRVTSS